MNTYRRLLGFARPLEKYAVPYFFYTLFYTIFYSLTFAMVGPMLTALFDPESAQRVVTTMPEFHFTAEYFRELINHLIYLYFGPDYTTMQVLVFVAVFIVVVNMLGNLFRYLGQRIIENLKINTLERLRNDVFDNVMGLHVGFFSNERKGDIISKITADVQVVQFTVASTLQVVIREPFLILGFLVVMITTSWELTIFSIIYLPLIALLIGSILKKLRRPAKEVQASYGEMVSQLDESLAGVKIIKGYNATGYIKRKFHAINDKFSRISRAMARRQQLASPMSEFLGIFAVAVLLVFGGYLVAEGRLIGADFIVYIAVFSQIVRPIRAMADAFANINQGIAAGDRVLGLLDEVNRVPHAESPVRLEEFKERIEFRDIKFSYENREVISGVSFTIGKGETVALVGPSGGGKSTLSDLIPRFYDVQGGQILVDGVDIRQYDIESLRSHMGLVAQETVLFNDTIEGNIRLGKQDATHEQIIEAARIANADNFIMETEKGYRTNIGDRGMKLSGGQRQRLSIARAVLKNPDILILDEATSALDTESEKLVQDALDNLLKRRTSLVIAHRLSTINHADKIIVIDDGRIAEQGTHKELMERGGVYAKLIELQQLA